MEKEALLLIMYGSIKLFCYIGWCYFATIYLGYNISKRKTAAVILGILRLAIGIFIGTIVIFGFVRSIHKVFNNELYTYLLVYPPVRVIEWGFIWLIIFLVFRNKQIEKQKNTPRRIWQWILGGIIISCLADIPVLIEMNGVPVGRIFC